MARLDIPLWRVAPQDPDPEILRRIGALLRDGGVIVYPTETFYGLGAVPSLDDAVRRVFLIKGREGAKALPLIAADTEAARRAVSDWPTEADRLSGEFWPGPLTLLLPAASFLPPAVHARTGKIAVRVSSHPVARALAAAAGGLLVSTSANLAGEPACTDPEELSETLLARVDGMVLSGRLPGGLPSTIVDLCSQPPGLVRAGCLPWERISEFLRS